eukprot:COSAG06_NODE_3061_length_5906_cov_26.812468_10_plen_309_part_00
MDRGVSERQLGWMGWPRHCMLLLLLALGGVHAADAAALQPEQQPCPAQPCPSHPGVTFCSSLKTPGQCDKPMPHAPCPPCLKPARPADGGCKDELDCSLGGDCVSGRCVCDPTWKPPNCVELNLLPANKSSMGFADKQNASWGAQAVLEDGQYHLIFADFQNCGLGCWGDQSQISRAVSQSPTGPFKKVEVIAGAEHTNPTLNKVPGGPYVIVSAGNGSSSFAQGTREAAVGRSNVTIGASDPPEAGLITMLLIFRQDHRTVEAAAWTAADPPTRATRYLGRFCHQSEHLFLSKRIGADGLSRRAVPQ